MRILVTGATGYIGSRLCQRLVSEGSDELFSLERPGHPEVTGVGTIAWDLRYPIDESLLPRKVDAVVHLALARDFRRFPESVPGLFAVNVRATIELLEYARKAGATRFFMASTGNSRAPERVLSTGESPEPPNDFYTASKLAAEALTRPYQSCFPVNVLRVFFPYGPNQDPKTVQRLIGRVRTAEPILLGRGFDGGGDRLSLMYVGDLVDTIATSIRQAWRGIFDVAAPEVLSLREIASEIGRQLGVDPVFEEGNFPAKSMTADLSALTEKGAPAGRSFASGLSRLLTIEPDSAPAYHP